MTFIMSMDLPIKFDSGIFFAYELLFKTQIKEFMTNCDTAAERIDESDKTMFSQLYHSRSLTGKVHEWNLDVKRTWDEIDENEKSVHMHPVEIETKEYINKFCLFLIEIPYLPYDLVILKAELSEKIFEIQSRNDLLNIFSPLNTFLGRFPGIIHSIGNIQKYRPAYLKFEKILDNEIIEKYFEDIKQLAENKQFDTKEKSDLFYNTGQKFRLSNFISEDSEHRLTITSKMNSFTILGSMDTIGNQSSLSNYEIVFKDINRQFFWARNTGFDNRIDYDFSTYIHFISISLYLHYQINEIDKHEVSFSSLVNEYRELKEKKTSEKESFYDRLNDFDEKLFFLKSDLKQIDFALKNFLNDTIRSIPNYNAVTSELYKNNKIFSEGILDLTFNKSKNGLNQIFKKLSELQKETLDLKEKFEKDIVFENNSTMNEYTKRNTWLTISIVILSIVITGATIYGIVSNSGG